MNHFIKIGGFIILGYIALWLLFMISMTIKLYFDNFGYPDFSFFTKYFNKMFYI